MQKGWTKPLSVCSESLVMVFKALCFIMGALWMKGATAKACRNGNGYYPLPPPPPLLLNFLTLLSNMMGGGGSVAIAIAKEVRKIKQ